MMDYTVTSTTITSYLKQLRVLYTKTIKIFSFSDIDFPKDHASPTQPCPLVVLSRLHYSMEVLSNYYKGIGKLAIQAQFDRRLLDGERVVDLKTLDGIMDQPKTDLPEMLSSLEKVFKRAFRKTNMAPRIEDKTVAKLWQQTTTSLCAVIMFDTKCRVGVVQNLQTAEYHKRKTGAVWTVIWVAKHKLGFKRPATLVLDAKTMEHMDRYYMLRKGVRCRDSTKFFVSNSGNEVVKVFDKINKNVKLQGIRYQCRHGGAPGEIVQLSGMMIRKQIETAAAYHDETTRGICADALQHSSAVAATHYRVGTSEVAIHQREVLLNVKMSEIMTCSVFEDPSQVLDISIDFIPPSYTDFTKLLKNNSKGLQCPRVKYDELVSQIQFSLIDDRAEVIARHAKIDNYSATDFGVRQLTSIAQTLGKMFWVNDKKTENLIIEKVKSIMENLPVNSTNT